MGTGAVYVTIAGLREHWGPKINPVETVFFFFNLVLIILNNTTLLLQLFCECRVLISSHTYGADVLMIHAVYPRQARRLITDPAKCIFVPLMVCLRMFLFNIRVDS